MSTYVVHENPHHVTLTDLARRMAFQLINGGSSDTEDATEQTARRRESLAAPARMQTASK